jgi:hypothetical protein
VVLRSAGMAVAELMTSKGQLDLPRLFVKGKRVSWDKAHTVGVGRLVGQAEGL